MTSEQAANRLENLCQIIPELLAKIPLEAFENKPAPEKWSKKEILGHLIDSATNNHQRFVRTQFEAEPFIRYDQNRWIDASGYSKMDREHLIAFWRIYNQHLVLLIRQIPKENLSKTCCTGEETHTIEWLIVDYVTHLEHHLKQLVVY
jgi:hypothetical protein